MKSDRNAYFRNNQVLENTLSTLERTNRRAHSRSERRAAERELAKIREKFLTYLNPPLLEEILRDAGKRGQTPCLNLTMEKACSSQENAFRFSDLFFDSLMHATQRGLDPREQDIYPAMLLVFLTRDNYKAWYEMMIDILDDREKQEDVRNFLKMSFMISMSSRLTPKPIKHADFTSLHEENNRKTVRENKGVYFWKVSGDEKTIQRRLQAFNQIWTEFYSEQSEFMSQLNLLQSWCAQHSEAMLSNMAAKAQDIEYQPRAWVKSQERDKVAIKIAPINRFGVNSFSFISEGYQFPNVGLELYGDFFGKPLMAPLSLEAGILRGLNLSWPAWLQFLLGYMVLDSYHEIVCGNGNENERTSRSSRPHRKNNTYVEEIEVRRHFRKLASEWWKPSEEAIKGALQIFGFLPPGHTFVGKYSRGPVSVQKPDMNRYERHLRIAPFLKYTEERLFKSLA